MEALIEASRTIRVALTGWPQTVRLILIIVVITLAAVVIGRWA